MELDAVVISSAWQKLSTGDTFGRILYRTSHAHAAESPAPTALVSENWVIYTYLNLKTKRAQVGVLSLVREMNDRLFVVFFSFPNGSFLNIWTELVRRHDQ